MHSSASSLVADGKAVLAKCDGTDADRGNSIVEIRQYRNFALLIRLFPSMSDMQIYRHQRTALSILRFVERADVFRV